MDSLYVYASAVTALIIIAPDCEHEQTKEKAGLESYKSRVCWLGFAGGAPTSLLLPQTSILAHQTSSPSSLHPPKQQRPRSEGEV